MKYFRTTLLLAIVLSVSAAHAQLTKAFNLISPADNVTIRLEGDRNAIYTITWQSADNKAPGATVGYSYELDSLNGIYEPPLKLIGGACCKSLFKDSSLEIPMGTLSDAVNEVFYNINGRYMKFGESITLKWTIYASASAPGPTYESKAANSTRKVTFVKGQFNQEYTPLYLATPLDNSSFFVEDNINVKINFRWNDIKCPGGCDAPEYQILFDSLNGDFSVPLYSYILPQAPGDTVLSLNQNVLAGMLYVDGVPRNTPKTYKWTVVGSGNSQTVYAENANRISLQRGQMINENVPFWLQVPVDNAIFKLDKDQNSTVTFSWNKTYTALPYAAEYKLFFDTAKATPDFNNPIFTLNAAKAGDTSLSVSYIDLRNNFDAVYGTQWKSARVKWVVQANVGGYKFFANDTFEILFSRGFFTGINAIAEAGFSAVAYPNPTNGDALLRINTMERTDLTISVIDNLGRVVSRSPAKTDMGETSISLPVSGLKTGIYFIRIDDGAGNALQHLKLQKL